MPRTPEAWCVSQWVRREGGEERDGLLTVGCRWVGGWVWVQHEEEELLIDTDGASTLVTEDVSEPAPAAPASAEGGASRRKRGCLGGGGGDTVGGRDEGRTDRLRMDGCWYVWVGRWMVVPQKPDDSSVCSAITEEAELEVGREGGREKGGREESEGGW